MQETKEQELRDALCVMLVLWVLFFGSLVFMLAKKYIEKVLLPESIPIIGKCILGFTPVVYVIVFIFGVKYMLKKIK